MRYDLVCTLTDCATKTKVSIQGHSGQSGHGGHGGSGQAAPGHHGNHGHGHSGGGNAIGGGGLQQTWSSVIKETRFSGEMFRNPLVPLMIYGMVFLSIMLIICLADNNLLDFAVQQHNEAQKKRMQEAAAQQVKADEASAAQNGAVPESAQGANQEISQQPQQNQQQQPQVQQQFDQQLSPAQNFLNPVGQPNLVQQPSFASPASGQQGYLQQSLNRQNSGGGLAQPSPQYAQPNYGDYGSSGAYSPYAAAPQMGYGQQGFAGTAPMQPMGMGNQFAGGGYHAAGSQRSGAYMQGGFKTGADGVSQVPMNRMVINR